MFASTFQGGVSVEVLSASDKNPAWTVTQNSWKSYDRVIKAYCISLDSHTAKLVLPNNGRQHLGLLQRFLVMQCYLCPTQPFTLELVVSDTSRMKRRILFSNSAKDFSCSPLYARVPNAGFLRGVWVNLSIDLVSFMNRCFPGNSFGALEALIIHSHCKIRRVFTMKSPLLEVVPRGFEFPLGTQHRNQLIVASAVQGGAPVKGRSNKASPQKKAASAGRSASICAKPRMRTISDAFIVKGSRLKQEKKPLVKQKVPSPKARDSPNPMLFQEDIQEEIHVENNGGFMDFTNGLVFSEESIEEDIECHPLIEHNYFPAGPCEGLPVMQPTFYSTFMSQATETKPYTPPIEPVEPGGAIRDSAHGEEELELLYDPILKCYYDPRTHEFYEVKV